MLFKWRLISIAHIAEYFLAQTPCYVQVSVFFFFFSLFGHIFYSSGYDAASMGHWNPTFKGNVVPHLQRCLLSVTCWSLKMRAMCYLALSRFNFPFTQCHTLEEWSTHHAVCLVLWFSCSSCANCIFPSCTVDLL